MRLLDPGRELKRPESGVGRLLMVGVWTLVALAASLVFLWVLAGPVALPGSGSSEVRIAAGEHRFTPSRFTLSKGTPVRLTLANGGALEHDLRLDDQPEVWLRARPGESTTIVFTPQRPGTFSFRCTLPGHADAGMVGEFTVVDNS